MSGDDDAPVVALLHPGLFFDYVAGADAGWGLDAVGDLEGYDVQPLLGFVVRQIEGEVLGTGLFYLLPEVDLFGDVLGLIGIFGKARRRVG